MFLHFVVNMFDFSILVVGGLLFCYFSYPAFIVSVISIVIDAASS
jgi:hypothetical protein